MALFNGEYVYPRLAQFLPVGTSGAVPTGAIEGSMWYDPFIKHFRGIVNGVVTNLDSVSTSFSGAANPPGGAGQCLPGQTFTNTTTGAFFDCTGTTWNLVTSGALTIANLNALLVNAIDCTQPSFAGANLGITINNCIAAAPANSAITLANFTASGAGTISTAVNVNKPIVVYSGGINFTQTASITLSVSGAQWIGNPVPPGDTNGGQSRASKGASLADQFILSAPQTSVQNMDLRGNRGSGFTGNGISVTAGGNSPNNIKIINNFIELQGGICINITGGVDTLIENNVLSDYGGTGIVLSTPGNTHKILYNTVFSNASATGPCLNDSSSGTVILTGNNFPNLAATDNIVVSAGELRATGNQILNSGGSSRIGINGSSGNPTLILQGNNVSGGAGFPALSAQGASLYATGGNSFGASGQTDAVLIGSTETTVFSGNKVNISSTSLSGVSGIHLKGDTIANVISHNDIKVSSTTPAGNCYGIWLDTSAGGHFLNHVIEGNSLAGTTQASFDVGIFFDNSTPLSNSGPNVLNNFCTDVTTAKCILRSDAGNVGLGFYSNNRINTGVTYALAGSTLDTIVDYQALFANLPNAGNGSRIYCSDCTPTTPTAGSGTGAQLIRFNSIWSGGVVTSTGFIAQPSTTVGALPAAAAGNKGQMIPVSDSTVIASEGQTCAGGSSNTALAFSNGTVWKCF